MEPNIKILWKFKYLKIIGSEENKLCNWKEIHHMQNIFCDWKCITINNDSKWKTDLVEFSDLKKVSIIVKFFAPADLLLYKKHIFIMFDIKIY